MPRRNLVAAGLFFLTLSLVLAGAIPQSGRRDAFRFTSYTLPASRAPAPDAAPVVYGGPVNAITNFAASPPWLTLLGGFFIVFAVIGGTLLVAHWRRHPPQISERATAIAAGGGVAVITVVVLLCICVLGFFAVFGYLFFGQQLTGATSPQQVTADELTNAAILQQIDQTSTVAFQTMSAPTEIPPTTDPSTPAAFPTATVEYSPTQTGPAQPFNLTVNWPAQMDVGDTATVEVSTYAQPIDLSSPTPALPFGDPFGSDYIATLDARLTADGFIVTTPDASWAGPQRLTDQGSMLWRWDIRPDPSTVGPRTLHVVLSGTWEPVPGAQGETARQVLAQPDLVVNVAKPIADPQLLCALSLLAALIGAGLCVPWLTAAFNGGPP